MVGNLVVSVCKLPSLHALALHPTPPDSKPDYLLLPSVPIFCKFAGEAKESLHGGVRSSANLVAKGAGHAQATYKYLRFPFERYQDPWPGEPLVMGRLILSYPAERFWFEGRGC